MKKKILIGFLSLCFIILAGISHIDWTPHLKPFLLRIEKKYDLSINLLGTVRLALLPIPILQLKKVSISEKGKNEKIGNFPDVQISLNLLSLLKKNLSIKSVKLISPSFYLTPFELWLKKTPQFSATAELISSQKKGGNSTEYLKIDFNTVEILKGEIIKDLIHLKNINLRTEVCKDSSFLFKGKANYENYTAILRGESSYPSLLEKVSLRLKIRKEKQKIGSTYLSLNKEKGNHYTGKIRGTIKNIDVPFIEKNGKFSASFNYGENLLTLHTFHTTFGKLDLTGKGKGTSHYFKISLQGNYLPLTGSATLESDYKKGKLQIGFSHVNEFSRENNLPLIGDTVTLFFPFHIDKDQMSLPHYSIVSDHIISEGNLNYKRLKNTSFFQGNIHFPQFSLIFPEEPSSSPLKPPFPSLVEKTQEEDKCRKHFSFAYLKNLKGLLTLSIQNFSYGNTCFIDSIKGNLEIDQGSARLKDLFLKGYQGTVKINGTLNDLGLLKTAYEISHLQLEEIPLMKEKASLIKKAPLNGKGNFTADISSLKKILSSLEGKGEFSGDNWLIFGFDPKDALTRLNLLDQVLYGKSKALIPPKLNNFLINTLKTSFSVEKGKVKIEDLNAKDKQITVKGAGDINLIDQILDLKTQVEADIFKGNPFLIRFYGPLFSPKWSFDPKTFINIFSGQLKEKALEKVGNIAKNLLGNFLRPK